MRHTLHLEATHLGTVKATRGGHTATALKAKGRIRADMGTPAVRTWPAAPGRRGRRGRSSCQSPAMRQLRHGPGHLQIHLGSVRDTVGRKSKAKTSAPEKEEALLCLAVHPAPGWHLAGRGRGTRCPTRAGEGGGLCLGGPAPPQPAAATAAALGHGPATPRGPQGAPPACSPHQQESCTATPRAPDGPCPVTGQQRLPLRAAGLLSPRSQGPGPGRLSHASRHHWVPLLGAGGGNATSSSKPASLCQPHVASVSPSRSRLP